MSILLRGTGGTLGHLSLLSRQVPGRWGRRGARSTPPRSSGAAMSEAGAAVGRSSLRAAPGVSWANWKVQT
eukprot:5100295-Pyramimonas_sp.AAC.1